MHRTRIATASFVLLITLLATAGFGLASPPLSATVIGSVPDLGRVHVTGPFVHDNLAIYLINPSYRSNVSFSTLDEAITRGSVTVSEQTQEQVSQLAITYTGDFPLFLHEGDRVKGGKQDRIVVASFVVDRSEKSQGIPAMCVEQGRWTAGATGDQFSNTTNLALAPKSVRYAAKGQQSQSQVWQRTAQANYLAGQDLDLEIAGSSLNASLDSAQMIKRTETSVETLGDLLESDREVSGIAIAIDGRIEEVSIYANHDLLAKLYPRLLRGAAVDAALAKAMISMQAEDAAHPSIPHRSAAAVLDLMMTSRDVARSETQRYAPDSEQSCVEYVDGVMMFTSTYTGSIVHRQWMRPDAAVWGERGDRGIGPQGLERPQIDTGLPIQQFDDQRFPAPPPPPPPSSES